MRLNNKGQLTTGEWCNDKDNSGQALTVQWCQMGTVNGPWHYDAQQKMMLHTGINKCLGLEPESGRPILRACDNHRTGMRIFLNSTYIFGLLKYGDWSLFSRCLLQMGIQTDQTVLGQDQIEVLPSLRIHTVILFKLTQKQPKLPLTNAFCFSVLLSGFSRFFFYLQISF